MVAGSGGTVGSRNDYQIVASLAIMHVGSARAFMSLGDANVDGPPNPELNPQGISP